MGLILTILKKERLVIAGQLKRSSGSVVANIAKGPVNEQTIHHQ
ncbi:MAG: four helix bundle protein [Saprospiraceae bacterium]|nr:four helix bundle protein [Saprospiraceae bacterium]